MRDKTYSRTNTLSDLLLPRLNLCPLQVLVGDDDDSEAVIVRLHHLLCDGSVEPDPVGCTVGSLLARAGLDQGTVLIM